MYKNNTIQSEQNIEVIRRKAHFLEVINSFASQLIQTNSVNEAVWSVTKHAVANLGYEDCVVYLLDDEHKFLIQCAAYGPKNPNEFNIDHPIILKIGEGISGSVAKSGIAEIIGDTSKDSRYQVDDLKRLSEISVPILSKGKVIGVIDSEHSGKNFFTQQDLEILKTIASMVSVKIDQSRAQEKLEEHKNLLEKRVEESTVELKNTIKKLQESNEEILQSDVEKATLLKEIHHRVKNNLQIVSSLLNLHANRSSSKDESNVFLDCQSRVKSMSIIHEQLYNKENLAQIDTKKYIEEITQELLLSYNAIDRVELKLDLEQVFFDIDTSVPIGLILNELIVNSLKHAFPKHKGEISIVLKQTKEVITLVVSDNGIGFIPNENKDTMGIDLIETLTSKIDGDIKYFSDKKGTVCEISIPFDCLSC